MADLQKDPLTRGQFVALGFMGTIMGAALTVPPAIYVLDPAIKATFLNRTDVPRGWTRLGSVFEIPKGEPKVYRVEFPHRQTYDAGQPGAVKEGDNVGSITNAALVSWRDGRPPSLLENRDAGQELSENETGELRGSLNVMSNACVHLGCPVRWSSEVKQIECPCHGGLYDLNGSVIGGPPPHGLWRYVFEVREDGGIFVRHEFEEGKPWVV